MKTEYNTTELQDTFKVLGFSQGFCAVENKETNERGSFDFEVRMIESNPQRVYFNYKKA